MPAGSHRFEIGTIGCTVLSDGYAAYPTPWLFPNADPEQLSRALESRRAPRETVLCPYTCLLVETARHVMLVDTGLGEASSTSGAILARLEMAGILPKDVDTVILTHAHPDHIGGALDPRRPNVPRPMFPNARHVISELEWEFWMGGHTGRGGLRLPAELQVGMESTARRSLTALRHQLEMVEHETEVVPGVRVIPAPGHTPGHLALRIGGPAVAECRRRRRTSAAPRTSRLGKRLRPGGQPRGGDALRTAGEGRGGEYARDGLPLSVSERGPYSGAGRGRLGVEAGRRLKADRRTRQADPLA
jgi:glyoxylase-like metal-dependent hydrolase (beta-lactamase superfamily II)